MSLLSSVSKLVSKATGGLSKFTASPFGNALSSIPLVGSAIKGIGAVAQAASAVTAIKEVKGQTPSSATQMASSASVPTKAKVDTSTSWFAKAKNWVMLNKKSIIIVLVVGVVGWLVYTFIFAKNGARRKSPRRVSQAARMRAAKAAKRRK